MTVTRPVLRYFGGKWRLAPWIISHLPPDHRCYVEPFGGAASVLMRKPRVHAEVYNDLDGSIVNVFRVFQDEAMARELLRKLEVTPFARDEFHLCFEEAADPIERARRTIIRHFFGFASQSAVKRRGFRALTREQGTTAAGDWANYVPAAAAFTERLKGVVIENKNAIEVIRQHDGRETLFYVDPPYVADSRNDREGYLHEMTDEQHLELLEVLKQVKGSVVLNGYRSSLYESLGWKSIEAEAYANANTSEDRKRIEVLWFNESAWDRQSQTSLRLDLE